MLSLLPTPHYHTQSYNDNGLEKWFRNSTTVKGLAVAVKAANNRRMPFPPELQLGVGAKTKPPKRGLFSFLSCMWLGHVCFFTRFYGHFFGCFFFKCYLYITHTLSHSYDDNGLEKWWFRNTMTAVVKAANNRRMSVSPPELQLGVGAKAAELTNRKKGPFFSF